MLYFVARTDIELLDRVRSLNPKRPAAGAGGEERKQTRGPRQQAQAQSRFGADSSSGGRTAHSQLGGLGDSSGSSGGSGGSGGDGRSQAGSVASSLADASRLAAPPVQALHRGRCVRAAPLPSLALVCDWLDPLLIRGVLACSARPPCRVPRCSRARPSSSAPASQVRARSHPYDPVPLPCCR